MNKFEYEVRQLDAWMYDDDWTVNESWHLGSFVTKAENHKRAFIAYLKRCGISFKLNRTLVEV